MWGNASFCFQTDSWIPQYDLPRKSSNAELWDRRLQSCKTKPECTLTMVFKKIPAKVQYLNIWILVPPPTTPAPFFFCLPYQSAFVPAISRAANLHDGCCVPAAIQCNKPPLASCFHGISIMQMQPQPVTLLLLSSTYSQHTASAAALHTGFQIPTCFSYFFTFFIRPKPEIIMDTSYKRLTPTPPSLLFYRLCRTTHSSHLLSLYVVPH